MQTRTRIRRLAITSLIGSAFLLAGCNDFAQNRFGGITRESRPTPAPALAISNVPSTSRPIVDENVKPAAHFDRPEELAFGKGRTLTPVEDPRGQLLQHPMRFLYQRAAERHATMDAYTFRLKRREVVNGVKQTEELIAVKLRREPFSVHLAWIGKEAKGRETIYVHGKFDNKMQVMLAPNDPIAFLMGGKMAVALDNPMVKSRSRYPITTTGFGSIIERYGQMVAGIERGDPRDGTAKYLGQVKREEFEQKVEAVYQVLPANGDPNLPKGGERWWYFDATHGLPILVIAHDSSGEVEYYCHDQIRHPVRLDDDDFSPERAKRK